MIKTSRRVLGVAAATLLALSPVAFAQLKAQDVVGVGLGMTVDQAETALRAHEPNFRFLKVYYRGIDGKPGTSVGKLAAALPEKGSRSTDISGVDGARPDSVMVYFGQSTGQAHAVYRQVHVGKAGVLAAELHQGLAAKYGPPEGTSHPAIFNRGVDAKGQPSPGCLGSNFDWQVQPSGFTAGCAQSIKVQLANPVAAGVYQNYRVWLFDHRLLEADAKAVQVQQQAYREQMNRKAQESAGGNKQRL